MILLSVLVVILSAVIGYYVYLQNIDKGVCHNRDEYDARELRREFFAADFHCQGECFFAQDYEDAKQLFFDSTMIAGAQSYVMDVEGLETGVAILEGGNEKFLIHISGTHGPESYAGSAVQCAALQYLGLNSVYNDTGREDLPTIIFIHALNPYGFKTGRRVNENNIDLNRNFLTDEEFDFVKARDPNYAGYVDLDAVLNPVSKPTPFLVLNEVISVVDTALNAAKYGITTLKRAMVAGNYHKSNGFGFGGFERSVSANNLIELLVYELDLPNRATQLALIDVHTGLGPSGVDTLLTLTAAEASGEKVTADYEAIFPTQYDDKGNVVGGLHGEKTRPAGAATTSAATANGADAASGYELTVGTVSGGFCNNMVAPHLNGNDKVCISQEFGTVSKLIVGKYSLEETYAHFHGTDEDKAYYGERYKDCFYVQTRKWKRQVVHRGLKLFFQAFEHLGGRM